MIGRVFRMLVGLACAFLASGAAMVLFVYSPLELLQGGGDKASEAGLLALEAATHSAVFAAPFALLAAGIGEWRGVRGVSYYALTALLIAALGFLSEYATEAVGEASIANAYASAAFLVSGLVAGFAYWLVAGRRAALGADRQGEVTPPSLPAASQPRGAAQSRASG
jgi:hypothetical protein